MSTRHCAICLIGIISGSYLNKYVKNRLKRVLWAGETDWKGSICKGLGQNLLHIKYLVSSTDRNIRYQTDCLINISLHNCCHLLLFFPTFSWANSYSAFKSQPKCHFLGKVYFGHLIQSLLFQGTFYFASEAFGKLLSYTCVLFVYCSCNV